MIATVVPTGPEALGGPGGVWILVLAIALVLLAIALLGYVVGRERARRP